MDLVIITRNEYRACAQVYFHTVIDTWLEIDFDISFSNQHRCIVHCFQKKNTSECAEECVRILEACSKPQNVRLE